MVCHRFLVDGSHLLSSLVVVRVVLTIEEGRLEYDLVEKRVLSSILLRSKSAAVRPNS